MSINAVIDPFPSQTLSKAYARKAFKAIEAGEYEEAKRLLAAAIGALPKKKDKLQ